MPVDNNNEESRGYVFLTFAWLFFPPFPPCEKGRTRIV